MKGHTHLFIKPHTYLCILLNVNKLYFGGKNWHREKEREKVGSNRVAGGGPGPRRLFPSDCQSPPALSRRPCSWSRVEAA